MDDQQQDITRAAAFLATQARLDLRGPKSTRTGKTRNTVNCTAGNKRCGNRCIPNSWDCRIEGKGTNSDLAAHKTDPLAGIASLQRGSKDLFQGVVRVNPSQVQRGRNSLIRGAVKLAPGDNLEKKKQLKRQLTEASTPIMAVLGVTLVGLAGHAGLKRGFASYRNGVGADIDRAASSAIDSILDRVPGIAGNRAATRAAGAAAITELGGVVTRGQRIGQTRAATSGNVGRIGPLSFRPNAANTKSSGLVASLNNVRARAKNGNLSYDEYKTQSVQALYGATNQGTRLAGQRGSIYSEHAANEFLVSKFKLNGVGVVGANASESMALRNGLIDTQLSERLGTWGETMRSDMKLRRMTSPQGEIRSEDISRYIRTVSPGSLGYSFGGMNAAQRNQAIAEAKQLMRTAIGGKNLGDEAVSMRRNLVSEYDRYFDNNAQMMSQPAAAANSPFGDGMTGLARYIRRTTNNPGPVLSRDHADLIIRNDYHVRVMQQRANYSIGDNTARRIAQQITRSPELPDIDSAYRVLNSNGFVQLSRSAPGAGKSPAASRTSRRTPAAAQPQQPRRLLTESELIRNAPPGYSPEGAREWARRQIAERGDSHESGLPPRIAAYLEARQDFQQGQRLGKPCGESFIPKTHECNLGKSKTAPPETGKRSNTGAKVAVAAALVGAAALGGRAAFKNRQNIPMYKGAAKYVDTGIKKMSSTKVRNTISKLPVQLQGPANKLVGKAKVGLAFVAADSQGLKLTKVDPINNFSTFKNPTTGHVMSVGSVDDTLVTFVSTPSGKAGSFDKFGIAFQTDLSFDQKQGLTKAQGLAVSKQVKSMFSAQLDEMPDNAVLFNNPYKDDGLGDKRSAIYKRFKFTELPGVRGGNMWALKNEGKLTKIPPEQADYVAKLIRGDAADTRIDLKCGKGAISEGEKCSKGAATKVDPNGGDSSRKLALTGVAAGAVVLTAALTAKSWTPAAQRIFDKARVVTPKDATYLTEGRSGKVWLSNDNKFVIKTSKGKVDMKKFTNEMNTQNALHSAGVSVPKIHNVDAKRGVVMMDYLNGYADSSKIPAANRAPILRKTVSELQKMSALNVSHGDLHPGNIMAKGTDVKIIDFGNAGPIAKNGLSDISNIQLQAKAADPKLFASIVANRKPLEAKISSGKSLTQDDFNSFYTRLQRDLKQTSAA